MSVERIQELLGLMQAHDLVELELEEGDFYVRLKKPGAEPHYAPVPAPMTTAMPGPAPAPSAEAGPAGEEVDPSLVPITSPIVGTFYAAPAPDADVFVREGSKVEEETVVCIVEAMKIMNEVKAGVTGTIEKILIENGLPVEYGQPLFLVRP